jgi:hypothetical protein
MLAISNTGGPINFRLTIPARVTWRRELACKSAASRLVGVSDFRDFLMTRVRPQSSGHHGTERVPAKVVDHNMIVALSDLRHQNPVDELQFVALGEYTGLDQRLILING